MRQRLAISPEGRWRETLVALAILGLLSGCASMPGGTPSRPSPPSTAGSETSGPRSADAETGESTRESPSAKRAEDESAAGDQSVAGDESTAGDESAVGDEVATTAEERKEILARRLDESLGAFDATLEEEQRRTATERDARTASTASSSGVGDDDYRGSDRSGDLRSERGRREGVVAGGGAGSSAPGSTGDRGAGRDRGTLPGGGSGAPDRGIPSGDDDDIVARRLRRAAEQETDPELKEKLWQEYIEYKRNAQG